MLSCSLVWEGLGCCEYRCLVEELLMARYRPFARLNFPSFALLNEATAKREPRKFLPINKFLTLLGEWILKCTILIKCDLALMMKCLAAACILSSFAQCKRHFPQIVSFPLRSFFRFYRCQTPPDRWDSGTPIYIYTIPTLLRAENAPLQFLSPPCSLIVMSLVRFLFKY